MTNRKLSPEELAELNFLYEERAAIIEFLGNVPREQAEREAKKQVFGSRAGNEAL